MNWRFIDWIWHVRGSAPLPSGQSGNEALDRLEPLFLEAGTSHERLGDTLTFTKKDPVAQDKMSVFDSGTLRIETGADGRVLRYHLISRALLFCFILPFVFLAFAQLTVLISDLEKPASPAAEKAAKAEADKKKEKAEQLYSSVPMNPIDKALGAPAPEKPKTAKEKADEKAKDEEGGEKSKTAPAYVFAGIFTALYLVGRVLEDRLAKSLFRRRLLMSEA